MRRRVLPRADSVQAGKSETRSEELLRIAILGVFESMRSTTPSKRPSLVQRRRGVSWSRSRGYHRSVWPGTLMLRSMNMMAS